jgi:hypothetical protein
MKRILLPVFLLVALTTVSGAQDDEKKITAGGYASWLHIALFGKPSDTWLNSSMFHNRINFKVYPVKRVTMAIEVRNRFVTGDMVTLDPAYSDGLASDPGWVDMSWNIFSERSFLINTMIDRAWIDFTAGNFQIRMGRQRINWSQALVWNPNDIFNTYSFFDFDYVERPGSDAIRAVYSTGPASAVEAVVKMNSESRLTAAALYRFSLLSTDFQVLAGETDEELFNLGAGWSASIGSFSFRGETTMFRSFKSASQGEDTFIMTAGIDRVFSDKLTALAQVMYSDNPVELHDFNELYKGGMTASQLAFSRFSAIGQFTYSPFPLLNITLSAIWYPDLKGYYAGPAFDFSLAEDVDFSLVWQHFDSIIAGDETRINLGFLRIKYNF